LSTTSSDTTRTGSGGGLGAVRLYRALWRCAEGSRRKVVAFMAMLLTSQAVKLSIPYFTGQAVNAMQGSGASAGGPDLAAAGWNIFLIFAVCLVGWALHGPGRVIERFVALGIRARFADEIYAKVVGLPMRWHEAHHSGDTIQRVGKASEALFNFSQHQFIYLQNVVTLVGPIAALFLLSFGTGLAALLGYLLIAFVLVRFDAEMIRVMNEENEKERRYAADLVDCLGNISTVVALRLQAATRHALATRLAEVFAPLRRSAVVNEAKWCAIDLLNNGIRCGLVAIYGWLAWRSGEPVLLGSAVMVFQYAQQAGGVVSSMAANYQDLVRYQHDFAGAEEILAEPDATKGAAPVPQGWREIRVERLSFAYAGTRGSEGPALRDVSLTLRRGSRIALVGESGSGKSTLLRVLAGLYDAGEAAISVDGAARPDLANLGAIATLIPQDPEVFESSIGQNVTMGVEHGPSSIRRACDLACLTPVIERLPHGLATGTAERGVNLSGGQKQRVALARGILAARDSSLIMLDEPTSSLDSATEARIYDNLLGAFPAACVVSSIHRLHLLPRFDTVVLMAEGRIVDAGAAAELLVRQPAFRTMWQSYAGETGNTSGEPIAA